MAFFKCVRKNMAKFLLVLGFGLRRHSEDRKVLEKIIFPFFLNGKEYNKILFVGTAWFTKVYNKIFKGKEFWTIDIDPSKKFYGAKKHIIDSIENINQHFKENELDVIICVGVFGFGLNKLECVETAIHQCFHTLRRDGIFILGWNDSPQWSPFPILECTSLKLFKPFTFPPLVASQFFTTWEEKGKYIYNFYIK
jgi:hypothetical protein